MGESLTMRKGREKGEGRGHRTLIDTTKMIDIHKRKPANIRGKQHVIYRGELDATGQISPKVTQNMVEKQDAGDGEDGRRREGGERAPHSLPTGKECD